MAERDDRDGRLILTTLDALIESQRSILRALEQSVTRTGEVSLEVIGLGRRLQRVEERLDAQSSTLIAMSTAIAGLKDGHEKLAAGQEKLGARLDAVTARLDDVSVTVKALVVTVDDLANRMDAVADRFLAVDRRFDDLQSQLDVGLRGLSAGQGELILLDNRILNALQTAIQAEIRVKTVEEDVQELRKRLGS